MKADEIRTVADAEAFADAGWASRSSEWWPVVVAALGYAEAMERCAFQAQEIAKEQAARVGGLEAALAAPRRVWIVTSWIEYEGICHDETRIYSTEAAARADYDKRQAGAVKWVDGHSIEIAELDADKPPELADG